MYRAEFDTAAALCPAGSMLVFDSTLWHAAAVNRSGHDRLAINQQFTRPFITPQIDYVRALGDEMVLRRLVHARRREPRGVLRAAFCRRLTLQSLEE